MGVIFSDADVKIWLETSQHERHLRVVSRNTELELHEVAQRDHRDTTREHGTPEPAPDAVVINTSGKSATEVLRLIIGHVEYVRSKIESSDQSA